jgi:hypothetical protein
MKTLNTHVPRFPLARFRGGLVAAHEPGLPGPADGGCHRLPAKKQSRQGAWKLQRTYNERSKHDTFPVVVPLEDRGALSKWVTLRALVVLKRWLS